MSAVGNFRKTLLQATLENAASTLFYRDLWKDFDYTNVSLETLSVLPVVDKADIRAAGRAAQVRAGLICDEIYTSGTTGRSLVTVRGHREQAYIREFFLSVLEEQKDRPLLRGLQINNPYHGNHVSIPTRIHFHRIGIYDKGSFEYGREILTKEHDDFNVERDCTVLVGLERCLRAFTADARDRFPEAISTKLKSIVSYSQYLTKSWRRLIESTWECSVLDRFSLAEIFGGAGQCALCKWWHFDPFVIPEVISTRTGNVLHEGTGYLVLTSLYPFQEAQPMIRYRTGDLVQVTHSSGCQKGEFSFKPAGRAIYGIPIPASDEWLLTPAAILEVIDGIPDIARLPRFLDAEQVKDPYGIGHPKYRASYKEEGERIKVAIEVELKSANKTAEKRVTEQILAGLVEESECFGEALGNHSAEVRVMFPEKVSPDLIAHST